MVKYILFFSSIIILIHSSSLEYNITTNLLFNNRYEEDMTKFENYYLPISTKYYIRLPKNDNEKVTLYLNFSKPINNNLINQIYIAYFDQYPSDDELSELKYERDNGLEYEMSSDSFLYKYSAVISNKKPYIIIYFKTAYELYNLSFYAYTQNNENANKEFEDINDIDCNYNFESKNIIHDSILHFRVSIKKYAGYELTIKLIIKGKDIDPEFRMYVNIFNYKPEDEEYYLMTSNNWQMIYKFKDIEDPNNIIKQYSFKSKDGDEYLAVQIESLYDIDNLGFIVIPENINDSSPVWLIVLISIIALIFIVGCVLLMVFSDKSSGNLGLILLCCFCESIARLAK